jgi:hypothetical protein
MAPAGDGGRPGAAATRLPGCPPARVPACQGARLPGPLREMAGGPERRQPACQGARLPGCPPARVPACQGARLPWPLREMAGGPERRQPACQGCPPDCPAARVAGRDRPRRCGPLGYIEDAVVVVPLPAPGAASCRLRIGSGPPVSRLAPGRRPDRVLPPPGPGFCRYRLVHATAGADPPPRSRPPAPGTACTRGRNAPGGRSVTPSAAAGYQRAMPGPRSPGTAGARPASGSTSACRPSPTWSRSWGQPETWWLLLLVSAVARSLECVQTCDGLSSRTGTRSILRCCPMCPISGPAVDVPYGLLRPYCHHHP